MSRGLLLRGVEVDGRGGSDVRLRGGRIVAVAAALDPAGDEIVDGRGGALLPGLHDHHIHLLSLAARASSLLCAPPAVLDASDLAEVIRHAARGARDWVRGVGYDDFLVGRIDRSFLDRASDRAPVRIQHRSGHAWVLSSAAFDRLRLAPDHPGVETDTLGDPTGWVFGIDELLRERLPPGPPPDLAAVGRSLAAVGVTGVTDATPSLGRGLAVVAAAVESGALPLETTVMTAETPPPPLLAGPRKLVLEEHNLPALHELASRIFSIHTDGRSVAIHAVSRETLLIGLAALEDAGIRPGDRIEHASLTPDEALPRMARSGLTVVTQPHFVREHGDRYLATLPPNDMGVLYRLRSLLDAGIAVGGGSDAPFGVPDPWLAMATAVDRRTLSGTVLGAREALTAAEALSLFTTPPEEPGGPPRRVRNGAAADLCLLRVGWREAATALSRDLVRLTVRRGKITFSADS